MRAVVRIYMTQKPLKATTKSEDQATVDTSLLRNTTETQKKAVSTSQSHPGSMGLREPDAGMQGGPLSWTMEAS